jgi:3-hydroxyacyl-CoA dehydrogenase
VSEARPDGGHTDGSIDRVALVGTGLVGASWAVVFARAGLEVTACDADPARLERAMHFIDAALDSLDGAGLLHEPSASIRRRIATSTDLATSLAGAQYVQESVAESLEIKRAVFATLDAATAAEVILASSTSSFPTSALAGDLPGRRRCLVVHPVNPPHLIPLTEVSGAPFTSATVVDRSLELMRRIGQSPIHVRSEIEGFVLNRLQWSLLAEACRLVADGIATPADVDAAVRDGLGRRWAFMGPFEVGDLNAPGGLGDYLTRFGATIDAIDASRRGAPPPLTAALVAELDTAARRQWPGTERALRLRSRDQRLLALAALLRR